MIFDKIKSFDFKSIKFGHYLAIISAFIMAITAVVYTPAKTGTFLVKVNDKEIGYLNSLDNCELIVKAIKASDGTEIVNKIKIKKVAINPNTYSNIDTAEKDIRKELGLKQKAYTMYIDGKLIAKLSEKDDLEEIIQGVENCYIPKYGAFKVVSKDIKEKIELKKEYVDKVTKLDRVKAVIARILKGQEIKKVYKAKQGDTIWTIATKNDKSIEEIKRLNPSIKIDKIKLNQAINLTEKRPYINMKLVVSGENKENIAYTRKFIPNKYLLKGITKVRVHGKFGIAKVTKKLTIENGEVIDEAVVKSVILKKPEAELLYSGIKQNILIASGDFIRPSRGGISSVFGRRWGKMHEGIDISASTGTPIVAADNGRVSFAGIKNGYGKCVIINHGNGLETLYGHSSKYIVNDGQYVKKGQLIAYVGSTGRSTGPHLHFEVRRNGEATNPMKYLQ